ncbi:MAG: hypothetical protein ACLQGJ_04490 [Candidatus Dormibacteria bacterium]
MATVSPTPMAPPATLTLTPTPTPIAGFRVASVTFISSEDGWVLGAVGGVLAMARTQAGGMTWTSATPPPTTFLASAGGSGVDGVRFADQQDGWAYGSQLWATHDGGASWTQVSLPGLSSGGGMTPIQGLETAAGTVSAVYFGASGFDIASAPVTSNSWTASATTVAFGAGPVPGAQLVIQGSAGWVLENDRTVVGGARLQSGAWTSWTPACATAEGPAVLAASTTQDLIAACDVGLWGGGSPTENAFVSTNGGSSFSQLATALPSACEASTTVASPSASVAAAGCGGEIVASFDGGGSWNPVYSGSAGTSITYVGFENTTQGVAVQASTSSPLGTLLMTDDGGHTWAVVAI